MEFNTKIALPEAFKADCVAVGVFAEGALTASARRIDSITRGAVRSAVASGDMTGARGTSLLLRQLPGVAARPPLAAAAQRRRPRWWRLPARPGGSAPARRLPIG